MTLLRTTARDHACAMSLLTFGFRGWMTGLRNSDVRVWESVFHGFSQDLGLCHAKRTVNALASWVEAIDDAARRPVEVCPLQAEGLCHDECMALSIIAAAQSDACPAMRACGEALLGHANVDGMLDQAEAFAGILQEADRVISPEMIAFAGRPRPASSAMLN
ncbi:MAG: hypothetical protein AAFU50_04335 [Pseudomonadota bacterium]